MVNKLRGCDSLGVWCLVSFTRTGQSLTLVLLLVICSVYYSSPFLSCHVESKLEVFTKFVLATTGEEYKHIFPFAVQWFIYKNTGTNY